MIRHISCLLAALAALTFHTGCGHTIYGAGRDVERMGRRMQGQPAEAEAEAPPYQGPNTYQTPPTYTEPYGTP